MTTNSEVAQRVLAGLSTEGLAGLAGHVVEVNRIGELLAEGAIDAKALRRFIAMYTPLVESGETDPQVFWSVFWGRALGRPVEVPLFPDLSPVTVAALREYNFRVMFFPAISEIEYPTSFMKPNWRLALIKEIDRLPLAGRWGAIESIKMSDGRGSCGYGGIDLLARRLGLGSRFDQNWDQIMGQCAPRMSEFLGLAVRLPSAEEWNLAGNVFDCLREIREDGPNFRSMLHSEWCLNACAADERIIMGGGGGYDGLARVRAVTRSGMMGQSMVTIGFRLVMEL
jgi:hypothetical protein